MADRLEDWLDRDRTPISRSKNPVVQFLVDSVAPSRKVTVRYFGGSRPGTTRTITPRKLFTADDGEAGYVEAFCHTHQGKRMFRLDRLEVRMSGKWENGKGVSRQHMGTPARHRTSGDGYRAARQHIAAARSFSEEMGGTDGVVKDYFFSLSTRQLDPVFREYGQKYGLDREDYARETFERWRSGARQMSGLVARRLFDLLPRHMPLAMKYELAEQIWQHFGPASRHSFSLGPHTGLALVTQEVADRLDDVVTNYPIPHALLKRFDWLADDDVRVKEQLLNHLRHLAKSLAVRQTELVVPTLQRQVIDHAATTGRTKTIVRVHKHEIHLSIEDDLDDSMHENQPAATSPPHKSPVQRPGSGQEAGYQLPVALLILAALVILFLVAGASHG